MSEVRKVVLVERSPEQMFALVDGVEDYPKFLPWCGGSEVVERTEVLTVAILKINYHGIRSQFSTANDKQFPTSMKLRLREGPFRQLEGEWLFKALGESACKIEFRLHYEFSSKLLEKVVGPVFNHIANTFVDAFVKRADQVYGSGTK
ncbi:type II toxin-antitoxin system RatA family toxin [Uliginosibacterium sp. H3]|uniref:Type II toxin-antitoxin system RatA family toxin n=1 Tax=Uliginosibacterium silvisoli TaxID=3114758 RepID=A0ABU6K4A1_9RHOO|nr:type II toxin-antitoxin system RatA family toxin [Uliginosibacterium sp. H3]